MSGSYSSISTNTKLSEFENFTIHSAEENEENNKQKFVEESNVAAINSKMQQKETVVKLVKPAPLAPSQSGNVDNGQNALQPIPVKKRTERFEIFTEGDTNDSDEGQKQEEKEPVNDNNKENGQQQFSPGKENIAPIESALDTQDKKNSPFEETFESFEHEEYESGDENSPTEYLTAKSSLILLSTKPKPQEKNSMYICYDKDIYNWMVYRERTLQPKIGYMAKQSEITEDMRKVLIDWFIDVAEEFELCRSSFFLSVFITDRALSKIDCPRDKLQLLGATSILIATKIQEIFHPQIKDIVYVTDDSYTEHQVRRMEKIILKMVDFELNIPLVDCFAEYFLNFAPTTTPLCPMARHLMWYFLELSTLDFQCIRFLPSHLAAAAFVLASYFQHQSKEEEEGGGIAKIWSNEIEGRMGIKRTNLEEPAKTLIKLHKNALLLKSQSVRKKYASSKRCRVGNISMPEFDVFSSQFNNEVDQKKNERNF